MSSEPRLQSDGSETAPTWGDSTARDRALDSAREAAVLGWNDSQLDPATLAAVVDDVYRLALRMVWHPVDAEEATRQIFARLERLPASPAKGSDFRLRVFGVAAGYLLTSVNTLFERQRWTFETLAEDLLRGANQPLPRWAANLDQAALQEETKIGCTQTVLLCLDRPHRLAYLLGGLFDLEASAAAAILELDLSAYGERLRHARNLVRWFMEASCGLVNPQCTCRCERRLGRALLTGRVDPDHLLFAESGTLERRPGLSAEPRGRDGAPERHDDDPALALFRDQALKGAPSDLLLGLTRLIRSPLG